MKFQSALVTAMKAKKAELDGFCSFLSFFKAVFIIESIALVKGRGRG